MALNTPSPGPNLLTEYLVSGVPWLTSSTVAAGATKEHELPAACSSIHARCVSGSSGALLLGFTTAGVAGTKRISIAAGNSVDLDLRTKTIVVGGLGGTATYELCIGLTTILAKDFPKYSGSATTLLSGV